MTKSAKGTVEKPGRQVKPKSGPNRSIPASGWDGLERKLEYKAGQVVKVDPAYTLQTCSQCGHVHRDNRPSQAVFASVPVSARGTGATARQGAIPWGTPTTREPDMPAAQSGI